MAGWSDTITLLDVTQAQDSEGGFIESTVPKTVFCNPFSVSFKNWVAAKAAGFQRVFEVQVWAHEYDGQEKAVYHGYTCFVEPSSDSESGDYLRLRLTKELDNG